MLVGQRKLNFLDIRDAIEAAALRLVVDADVLSGRTGKRTDVESAANDAAAVWVVAKRSAVWREYVDDSRRDAGGLKYSGSYSIRTKSLHEFPVFSSLDVAPADAIRRVAQTLVREEEERFVPPTHGRTTAFAKTWEIERSTQTATELTVIVIDSSCR